MAATRKTRPRKAGPKAPTLSAVETAPPAPEPRRFVPEGTEPAVEIIISETGELTIEGQPGELENGAVEGGCIVGSLRGAGVFVPRIRIPLDMCRMAGGGRPVPMDDED
jgi:hypothetical protein